MRTLVLEQPGNLRLVDTPVPAAPGPGEALVKVRRIGICGTDIHAFGGKQPFFSYPRILGHELGVEIAVLGADETDLQVGDLCSVEPYLNCGKCVACRQGKTNCCAKLQVLGVHIDGGMREHIIVPTRKLHRSKKLTLDQLALVETLGIGCHAVDRARVEKGEWALVIGAGPIGLAVMQFALEAGANVVVLDVNQARLDFCKKTLGVPYTINAATEVALDRLRQLTSEELPTVVFDATGSPRSMNASFEYPAQGGRLVFVGLFQGDVTFNDPNFHRRELTLLASRNARSPDFERIIRLIETGRIDTTPWITHRAKFAEVMDIFGTWTRPEAGVIKAMISVD
ncbi:MAG TPA: zinc-binding alcohol dehydrogenase family protein [Opitutaceae bacterium]|nr:zinc-binding alcohol dehydrogenase family protein [Opitutaceae bacterium]